MTEHTRSLPVPYWTCDCPECESSRSKGHPNQGPRPSYLLDGIPPPKAETVLALGKPKTPKEVAAMLAIDGETQEQRIKRFRAEMVEKRRAGKP